MGLALSRNKKIIISIVLGLILSTASAHAAGDYRNKAKQAMEYVTNSSNNLVDPATGLLWSSNFTGDLSNSEPCWSGSYFYHTARAVMGMRATGVGVTLADAAVNRVFVENYRENGTWSYPHEPWYGRMSYPNNDGSRWPNNSIYEDAQAWQLLSNVLTVMNSLASTGTYKSYVEKLIDGIINQDVPVKGGYAYNSTTGAMQYYNGSAWVPATRYTALLVGIMKKANQTKYGSEISKGTAYLNDNTMEYIENYSTWKAYLTPYFISTYALMGNQSMVDMLFTTYLSEYGNGTNFTHSFQQLHAGNLSINSNLYHAIGINTLVSAYNATANETYLTWARQIAEHMLIEHWNTTGNYFTNLNEMNTSRSTYCNYQKALAEINGVAAASFVKLSSMDKTPPIITLYIPANNSHLSSTNITFNFSAIDNFVDLMNYTLYVDGAAVQTGYITNNTPNTTSISVPDGFHNWSLAVSDDAGNTGSSDVLSFSAGGYVITDLPNGRRAVLVENESVDVTVVPQLGVKDVYLARGVFGSKGKIIAKLTLNFTSNISLSSISLHTNKGQRKAVLHRSSWPSNVKAKTLLIPKVLNTSSVYICPNATSLSEVQPSCAGVFTVNVGQTVNNVTISTATVEDDEYYLASGITGTGGGESEDTSPPSITIISPANTSYNYGTAINITYGASEAIAADLYNLDGGGNTSFNNGTTSITPSIGPHNITIWAMDSAGNWGSATKHFTVRGVTQVKVNVSSIPANTSNSSGLVSTDLGNYSWTVTTNDTTIPIEIIVNVSVDIPSGVSDISGVSGAIPSLYFHITVNDSAWYDSIENIQIKLYYTEADIPSGIEESTLRPVRYTSGSWLRLVAPPETTLADGAVLYASGVDMSNNYAWANLSRFSVYGLGGSVTAPSPSEPSEGVEGDNGPPLVVRSGFTRITPEVVPDIILNFNYMTKQFYVTAPQLYGVLGALDSYPITQGLQPDIDFYAARPTKTLEVLPGVIIAELKELYTTGQRDAYAAATELVLAKYKQADKAIITRGDLGVDSLAAVAYARYLNAPVLLVTPESVPAVTRSVIEELGVNSTIIIGGQEAVSGDVETALPSPSRIGGQDRYETAVKVAEMLMVEKKVETIVVTDGRHPDPNVVMLASYYGAPIVYTAGDKVPKETADFLRKYKFRRVITTGLSDAVEVALKALI
jgi:hypothetical protein